MNKKKLGSFAKKKKKARRHLTLSQRRKLVTEEVFRLIEEERPEIYGNNVNKVIKK